MKLKNGDILTTFETLQRISDNPDLKFNVVLGYMLARNKEKLRPEAVIIYDMRREIVMEHGKIEGKDIIVPGEYVDEVNKKIEELMNIETDVEIQQIPIDLFEHQEMNMEDIDGLKNLIRPFSFTGPAILEEKTDG